MRRFAPVVLTLLAVFHEPTLAGDAVTPGELVIEPATLWGRAKGRDAPENLRFPAPPQRHQR
jgi:hypothetical protein